MSGRQPPIQKSNLPPVETIYKIAAGAVSVVSGELDEPFLLMQYSQTLALLHIALELEQLNNNVEALRAEYDPAWFGRSKSNDPDKPR